MDRAKRSNLERNRIKCESCPAWDKIIRKGSEVCVPEVDDEGKPLVKNGKQVFKKNGSKFVTKGLCSLRAPKAFAMQAGLFTFFPETCSDWWCEDPAKYAMIDRLAKK